MLSEFNDNWSCKIIFVHVRMMCGAKTIWHWYEIAQRCIPTGRECFISYGFFPSLQSYLAIMVFIAEQSLRERVIECICLRIISNWNILNAMLVVTMKSLPILSCHFIYVQSLYIYRHTCTKYCANYKHDITNE